MFHEAPTPLSPAQRIRFSGMWDVCGTDRITAAAANLRSTRPNSLETDLDERETVTPHSPAQRIKAARAQSAGRSRSRGARANSTGRPPRPTSAHRPPPVAVSKPETPVPVEETSFGSLAPWDKTSGSQELGFVFSQLLDPQLSGDHLEATTSLEKPASPVLLSRPVLSPSPREIPSPASDSEVNIEDTLTDDDQTDQTSEASSDVRSRTTFEPAGERGRRPWSAAGLRGTVTRKARPVSAGARSTKSVAEVTARRKKLAEEKRKRNTQREQAWDSRFNINDKMEAVIKGSSADSKYTSYTSQNSKAARPSRVICTTIGKGRGQYTDPLVNGKPLPWLDPKKQIKRKPLY